MPDQKSTARYLTRKGMNATQIHQDLFTTLGLGAVSHPTVTCILGRPLFSANSYWLRNWPLSRTLLSSVQQSLKHSATNHLPQFISWPRLHVFRKVQCATTWSGTLGSQRGIYARFLMRCLKTKNKFGRNVKDLPGTGRLGEAQ
jgi:hypothetical protein